MNFSLRINEWLKMLSAKNLWGIQCMMLTQDKVTEHIAITCKQ